MYVIEVIEIPKGGVILKYAHKFFAIPPIREVA